jgi:Cdc6-like AAA superfamily ATPase
MVFTDKDGGLPPGQPYIQTSTLRSFVGMTRLLADSQYSRAMIGIAVGEPGIGKSVAICSYQQEASSRSIAITVPPRPTPHALIGSFMTAFEGKTCARQHSITLDDLFETIEHQNRRLVILDGADYLNDPCLDLLCTLFDRMQRPLLLVGLPQLLQRSLNHSRLFDRIGLTLRLPPLSYEEVLQVVLPALELPGWEFNVGQEADYLLGEQLWEYSYPSLRRLSNLLQAASTLALREHEPRVTESYIRYAMQLQAPLRDRQTMKKARLKERRRQIAREEWHEYSHEVRQ